MLTAFFSNETGEVAPYWLYYIKKGEQKGCTRIKKSLNAKRNKENKEDPLLLAIASLLWRDDHLL
jgi:hypothetical protein